MFTVPSYLRLYYRQVRQQRRRDGPRRSGRGPGQASRILPAGDEHGYQPKHSRSKPRGAGGDR